MEEFAPPPSNASALPVADVSAPAPAPTNVEYESYPVRKPEADLNDFKIQVRASTLDRCRKKLQAAAKEQFRWHELVLGLATVAIGAFLGSLPANLAAGSKKAIFFYTGMPVVGVAAFVAYLFLRRSGPAELSRVVTDVLAELPDPDKTR